MGIASIRVALVISAAVSLHAAGIDCLNTPTAIAYNFGDPRLGSSINICGDVTVQNLNGMSAALVNATSGTQPAAALLGFLHVPALASPHVFATAGAALQFTFATQTPVVLNFRETSRTMSDPAFTFYVVDGALIYLLESRPESRVAFLDGSFTVRSGTHTISFGVANGCFFESTTCLPASSDPGASITLESVTLTEVAPEPKTLGLMAISAIICAFSRRRSLESPR